MHFQMIRWCTRSSNCLCKSLLASLCAFSLSYSLHKYNRDYSPVVIYFFSYLGCKDCEVFGGPTHAKSCRLHISGAEQEHEFPLSSLSLMEKLCECETGTRWSSLAYSLNLHTFSKKVTQQLRSWYIGLYVTLWFPQNIQWKSASLFCIFLSLHFCLCIIYLVHFFGLFPLLNLRSSTPD